MKRDSRAVVGFESGPWLLMTRSSEGSIRAHPTLFGIGVTSFCQRRRESASAGRS